MTNTSVEPTDDAGAQTPPSSDKLAKALKCEVYDHEGKTVVLGDIVNGKRSVLIFTRHFWCLNCQAYVRAVCEAIPPTRLPSDVQILIIGNGSWQPIDTYATASSCVYPIYTDPVHHLHSIFRFKSNLKEGGSRDAQRDYMRDAGSTLSRIFGGIKGALGNIHHTSYIGPKALNGGEVILTADGHCEYMYRMQNTVDHTNIAELVKLVGSEGQSKLRK